MLFLRENRERLLRLEEALRTAAEWKIQKYRHTLGLYLERYKGLSPLEKLNQGFAFVTDQKGRPVTSIAQVKQKDCLEISVTDGVIRAEVVKCRKEDWNL